MDTHYRQHELKETLLSKEKNHHQQYDDNNYHPFDDKQHNRTTNTQPGPSFLLPDNYACESELYFDEFDNDQDNDKKVLETKKVTYL